MTTPPEQYLDKLSEKIRAELKREATEKENLRQTTELRKEGIRRISHLENLAKQTEELLSVLSYLPLAYEATREGLEEISERIERIERTLLLILATTCRGQNKQLSAEVAKVIGQLTDQPVQSLVRRLRSQISNLAHLREQAAQHGNINIPLDIVNEIEAAKEEIVNLQTQLDEYGKT